MSLLHSIVKLDYCNAVRLTDLPPDAVGIISK